MSFELRIVGGSRSFAFKNVGMQVMCHVMRHAGALADDEPPPWPEWPADVTFEREEILDEAVEDPAQEASLSASDRKLVWSKRTALEERRRARSKSSAKVPAFKFESCDGWIVDAEECRIVADKLRAFGEGFDATHVDRIEAERREVRLAAVREMKRRGQATDRVSLEVAPLELSIDEWKRWILDFANFNADAAANGGYRVT